MKPGWQKPPALVWPRQMGKTSQMSSSLNAVRRPSVTLLLSPVLDVQYDQTVTTTASGRVAPTESGPEDTSSEDQIPNDWWICTDDPGPTDEFLARIRLSPSVVRKTVTVTVDSSNWKEYGYPGPPNSGNYKVPGTFLFCRGIVVGRIAEVNRVENWKKLKFDHVYIIEVQESGT